MPFAGAAFRKSPHGPPGDRKRRANDCPTRKSEKPEPAAA